MKEGGLIFTILAFSILLSTFSSAQLSDDKGLNWDRECVENECQTTVYSYQKYWNDGGDLIEIDESFHDCSTDEATKYCTNEYHFKAEADQNGKITAYKDKEILSFNLLDFLNQSLVFNPIANENSIIYEDIIQDVDLRYSYLPDMIKEEIIINNPIDLPKEDFNLVFNLSGSADFLFLDSIICDNQYFCETLEMEITDSNIILTIPISFFDNPEIEYPVIIDPTIILDNSSIYWNGYVQRTLNLSTDISEYKRTNNPSSNVYVGTRPAISGTNAWARGDIDWNVSSVPDSSAILNITLSVYPITIVFPGSNITLNVTAMDGNSDFYEDNISECYGNCHFYQDMENGSIYATGSYAPSGIRNISLGSEALLDFETSLVSDIFSMGFASPSGGNPSIGSRNNPDVSKRPILTIIHSYEIYNLTYDANGNLINGFGKVLAYDGFNRLRQVNDSSSGEIIAEYWYNHEGTRVKKVEYNIDSNGTNATTYYPTDDFVQTHYTNGTIVNETYIKANGKLLARIDDSGNVFYYHPDHLGSTTLVTNESGDVVEEIFYLPFGGTLIGSDEAQRFLFTGKEKDKGTEFYYYGARYYDDEFRHFLQPDSVIQDIYNPQDLNRYAYVRNNPYKYKDPSGNYLESAIDVGFIIYDVKEIQKDPSFTNYVALGADVLGAALPGATGFGAGARVVIRTVEKGDKLIDTYRGVDTGADALRSGGNILESAGKLGNDISSKHQDKINALQNKFNNFKDQLHLGDKDDRLVFAQQEINGERVLTKNHITKVHNTQKGLLNEISKIKSILQGKLSSAERRYYEKILSEYSRLLDHTERFVPR